MYLSHGELEGGLFTHLPNAVYPTFVATSLFTLLNTFQYLIQMAYFNNANFYSTSASEEPEAYPFLNQTLATEGVGDQVHITLADRWGMTGSQTSHRDTVSYGKHYCDPFVNRCLIHEPPDSMTSATSYMNQTDGYSQAPYSGHHWPAVGQQAPPYHPDFLSQDVPFGGMAGSEAPTVVVTPSSGKNLFHFGTSRNRALTDHKQSHSTTGGQVRVGPLPARSIR